MLKKFSFILLFGGLISNYMVGQTTNSPYSVFGLGEMHLPGYVQFPEYGGASIGLMEDTRLNFSNPASYRSIDSLRFALEIGLVNNTKLYQNSSEEAWAHDFNITQYAFGFRISRWWHTGIGLMPFSNRGYKVKKTGINILDGENYEVYYVGSGNLNRLTWGNSISILPNLSVGVNANLLFGELLETKTVLFPNSLFTYNTQLGYTKSIQGIFIETGLMYTHEVGEYKSLNFGATFTPEQSIEYSEEFLSGNTDFNNLVDIHDNTIIDTTSYYKDSVRTFSIPMQIGFGLSYVEAGKQTATFSVNYGLWNELNSNTLQSSITQYKNNLRVSAGYSFIPKWNHVSNYFKRMTYRFGAFFDNSSITVQNKPVNEFAVSMGVGLPIKTAGAMINASFELGQKGMTNHSLVKENYIKLNLKLNFTEIWFVKQKYD